MSRYRRITVPVRGGESVAGVWAPEATGAVATGTETTGTVLAVHGITASHMAWPLVAAGLPDLRVIAPDLRGRGGSRSLPGPWGMPQHADDLVRLLDATGVDRAFVLAHSMGAFASVTLASRHPDRVSGLVLVDGGLPLPVPPGTTDEDLPQVLLGPAAERLSMTFPDRESYRAFWRAHPAFADSWDATVERYVDYDLVGEPPVLRPASSLEAVSADSRQLNGDTEYLEALGGLAGSVHFLRAPRGLLNQLPGLYSPDQILAWQQRLPRLLVRDVPNVNHYTVIMSPHGATAVAAVVREIMSTSEREVRL